MGDACLQRARATSCDGAIRFVPDCAKARSKNAAKYGPLPLVRSLQSVLGHAFCVQARTPENPQMNLENRLRQHGLTVAFVATLLATACGGTFSGAGAGGGLACTEDCELCEGPSTTRPGECCPICEPSGGAPSGAGAPGAGAPSGGAAGGGTCNGVACPAIACGPGWTTVYKEGACCGTCVPDGGAGAGGAFGCDVGCPAIDCAMGYMLEQKAGECCPSCVPNDACTAGRQSYETLRQQLISQPGAVACKVDKDCALLPGNAYCGDECSQTPVNAAAAQSIDGQLNASAAKSCSTCTPIYPPCAAPFPPVCVNGQCVINIPIAG